MTFYAYRPLLANKTVFGLLLKDNGKDVVLNFGYCLKTLPKKQVTKVWCKKTIETLKNTLQL